MDNKIKVAILVATDFEEIELVGTYDILKRADYLVDLVSIDNKDITSGKYGLEVENNIYLKDVINLTYDAIIIPGGPGHKLIKENVVAKTFVIKHNKSKKLIAAICVGPTVLAHWELLREHAATCYPVFVKEFTKLVKTYCNEPVVISDNIITSQSPATTLLFGISIVKMISGETTAKKIIDDCCLKF